MDDVLQMHDISKSFRGGSPLAAPKVITNGNDNSNAPVATNSGIGLSTEKDSLAVDESGAIRPSPSAEESHTRKGSVGTSTDVGTVNVEDVSAEDCSAHKKVIAIILSCLICCNDFVLCRSSVLIQKWKC